MRKFPAICLVLLMSSSSAFAATDFISLGRVSGHWYDAKFSGKTSEGYTFEITRDGRASLNVSGSQADGVGEIWSAKCVDDAMTDVRSCVLSWEWPAMIDWEFLKPDFPSKLCVSNTNWLVGRPLMRMNSRKPIEGMVGGCFAQKEISTIMDEFKVGSLLRVRTYHIANSRIVDAEARVTPAYLVARDLTKFLFDRAEQQIKWPKAD